MLPGGLQEAARSKIVNNVDARQTAQACQAAEQELQKIAKMVLGGLPSSRLSTWVSRSAPYASYGRIVVFWGGES